MKKVTINLDDLTTAMDDSFEEVNHYLDTENGEVISIAPTWRGKNSLK